MASATKTYDFIVVGAGPAGVMVATTLASSKRRPSVLLIEGGGRNDKIESRIDGKRWSTMMTEGMNYGNKTAPQVNLDNRILSYDRGRGLGGGSAINFCCWTVPPKDDFEFIADLTGDEEWRWITVQARIKRIETYFAGKGHVPDAFAKYLQPDSSVHGHQGPIKIGFPVVWERQLAPEIDSWIEAGYKLNLDHNSGISDGIAICASTAYQGYRSTAADALTGHLSNLDIITDTEVTRVLFEESSNRIIGIATRQKTDYLARFEVILSAGSLSSPHILMHSGIGPEDQLARYGIPVKHRNSSIGTNLKDHYHAFLVFERNSDTNDRGRYWRSKEIQAAALQQWHRDRSGLLSEIGVDLAVCYTKLNDISTSPEYASLPRQVQSHLNRATVPHCEYLINEPNIGYFVSPETYPTASDIFVCIMNPQSVGKCVLQSADSSVPLLFDPQFFSHPYDRRVAIEATRNALRVARTPSFAKDTIRPLEVPASESEEDILNFWRKSAASTWHPTGTCKMAKSEDENGACVDTDFKVFGVTGLRVADMSVCPILPNAHTQTMAYLIGLMAGDKLVAEYDLDS